MHYASRCAAWFRASFSWWSCGMRVRVDPLRAAAYGLAAGLCEDVLAGQTGAAWTISTVVTAALDEPSFARIFCRFDSAWPRRSRSSRRWLRALLFWIDDVAARLSGRASARCTFDKRWWRRRSTSRSMIAAMLVARSVRRARRMTGRAPQWKSAWERPAWRIVALVAVRVRRARRFGRAPDSGAARRRRASIARPRSPIKCA